MSCKDQEYCFVKPRDLFRTGKPVKVCAPMVRYSKLPFRMLVRRYGVDLAFTPMIICDSFIMSQKARDNEFVTHSDDRPLIVQFAAKRGTDLADAAEIVYANSDGVDINCGCPQKWALVEGIGASLMGHPQLVKDMVRDVRNRIPDNEFTISVKTRIHDDIRKTVEFSRQAEHAGISFISVHGRTASEKCEPVHVDALKVIKDSISIPCIGNGDVFTMADAKNLYDQTGVDGVMSARGLLRNPALFLDSEYTPVKCIEDWVGIALKMGTSFTLFHNHLSYMLDKALSRAERKAFTSMRSIPAVLDYLEEYLDIDLSGIPNCLEPQKQFDPSLSVG